MELCPLPLPQAERSGELLGTTLPVTPSTETPRTETPSTETPSTGALIAATTVHPMPSSTHHPSRSTHTTTTP